MHGANAISPARIVVFATMGIFSNIFSGSRRTTDPLDKLLANAARSRRGRERFYRHLIESQLWVPGEVRDGELLLQSYTLDGRITLLLFTSEEMSRVLRDAPPVVEIPARTLLATGLRFERVVLNYATRNQKELTPSELRGLIEGSSLLMAIDTATTQSDVILLGPPKDHPVRLMHELTRSFPLRKEVVAAWIIQTSREGIVEAPRVMIVIELELDGDARDQFLANVRRMALALDEPRVEIIPLTDGAIEEYLRHEAKPFYARGATATL